MNFTDFITNSGKRINKEYFINLIQISRIDGRISATELELLHKEGLKFGLTEPEIDILISSEINHQYTSPYSLKEKFEHLYNMAEIILADDIIKESEMKMIRKVAIEAGFEDYKIDKLLPLLFEGIRNNENEEALLAKFKKQLF